MQDTIDSTAMAVLGVMSSAVCASKKFDRPFRRGLIQWKRTAIRNANSYPNEEKNAGRINKRITRTIERSKYVSAKALKQVASTSSLEHLNPHCFLLLPLINLP